MTILFFFVLLDYIELTTMNTTTKEPDSKTAVPFVLISASFFVLVVLVLIYIRNARRTDSSRNNASSHES